MLLAFRRTSKEVKELVQASNNDQTVESCPRKGDDVATLCAYMKELTQQLRKTSMEPKNGSFASLFICEAWGEEGQQGFDSYSQEEQKHDVVNYINQGY
ncbi:unnamed protein product [Linum trigynum]|uniref:Uncharacterized protein n=1 Tax=Linum trigynum TaxID=586398 RepID=A0AAV2ETR0_9ROSI